MGWIPTPQVVLERVTFPGCIMDSRSDPSQGQVVKRRMDDG